MLFSEVANFLWNCYNISNNFDERRNAPVKRFISICLAAAAAFVAAITVSADEEVQFETENVYSYAESLGEKTEFEGIVLPEDAELIDLRGASDDNQSEANRVPPLISEGSFAQSISLDGEDYYKATASADKKTVAATFDVPEDYVPPENITGLSIGFGVYASGKSASGINDYVSVTLSVSDETRAYTASLPISVSKACLVYVDTSAFDPDFIPRHVSLRVWGNDTFVLDNVIFTDPYYTDSYFFEYQDLCGISTLSVLSGSVHVDSSYIDIDTAGGEAAIFVSDSFYGNSGEKNKVKYVSVGAASGSAASVGIDTLGATSASQSFFDSDDAHGSAVFRLTAPEGAVIKVRSTEGQTAELGNVRFYATDEKIKSLFNAISSLSVDGDKLVGSGTLDYDTVSEYSNCSIGVYMVAAVGDSEPILLGKIRVATRFSFELSLKDHPHAASDYLFYAAIITEHNVQKRVSEPKFATYANDKNQAKSRYGLYGVDPISVYEAGSPYVMVDVDLSRLVQTGSLSSYTVSRGGYVFELDREYVNLLDAGMEFYRSTGVQVYAKLYASSEIVSKLDGKKLTYSGKGEVMLRADTDEGANMYLAVTSFLCSKYPNITSFVLGSGVNSSFTAGAVKGELYDKVKNTALAARLIYGAASEITDVFVTIPFSTQNSFVSAEVFAALTAERINAIGGVPWAVMFTGNECKLPVISDSIIAAQHFNKTSVATCSVFSYAPETLSESVTEDYSALCDDASSTSVRVVFLSEKGLDVQLDRNTLGKLKRELKADGVHLLDMSASPAEEFASSEFTGKAALWDFTAAHSTLGWIAGYGVKSLSSAPEEYLSISPSPRVLRIVTENTAESDAGIILCRPKTPLNLLNFPIIEIVYSHGMSEAVNAVFVFGNGENRAEFVLPSDLEPDADGKYRVICDLTEFAKLSTVAYMGVIVYSSESVNFDISSISASSYSLSDAEISELISAEAEEVEESIPLGRVLALSGITAVTLVFTVRAFILALRRDKKLKNVIKPRRYRF